MIEIHCPKCLSFTPLIFDEPYQWQDTQACARNVLCTHCSSVLSILKGEGVGAHALQKIAELAYYASATDPAMGSASQPISGAKRPTNTTRRLKLVP